jgi:ureidoglycolate hydrolase
MARVISVKNFKRYGWVIEFPKKSVKEKDKNLFRIVRSDRAACGWRIAYLVVRDKEIRRLEQHPMTFESFEPAAGRSLLYVADKKDPRHIECFRLNRPVILKKGIWHGVVTQTREAEIKITENAKVKCISWRLGFNLNSNGYKT